MMESDMEGKIKEIIQEYADNQDEMNINAVVASVIEAVTEFLKVELPLAMEAYFDFRRQDERER